jgi:hypothetical protein
MHLTPVTPPASPDLLDRKRAEIDGLLHMALKDTSVVVRELGRGQLRCFASREYLRDRGMPHATSAGTSTSSSRRSRHGGAGGSAPAVAPSRSRCADGSSSTAIPFAIEVRREGLALPACRERSSSKAFG